MDPIEKAIRNALDKGNAEDRAFREKVYRSAFSALERATKAQPDLTVEVAIKRRKSLQAKIASIESEYLPALPAEQREAVEIAAPADAPSGPAVTAPEVSADRGPAARASDAAPPIEVESPAATVGQRTARGESRLDVGVGAEPSPGAARVDVAPDRDESRARRRRPLAAAFIAVTLFAAVAIAGWWALQVGLFKLPSEIDTSVPNPPKVVEGEDFDPDQTSPGLSEPGVEQERRNWITVFAPADSSAVNAPAGATAVVSEDESGQFLRIRSGEGGASVVFDVGQGVLEQIAGRKAVFDIVARSEEGKQTEISISCDFAELGDCGRRRYVVGYERAEYLFDVQLPTERPGSGGSIAIDSDFANEGNAVDIYQIRVSVTE